MLIWINGAFGAGKTHTAFELHRRLPDAHVADPEILGFALRRVLPRSDQPDFQDLPQWRSGVVDTLVRAAATHCGPVIVPMTLVEEHYFDEIVGGLRSRGVDLRHIALQASPETLHRRLRGRLEFIRSGGRESWAMQQIPRCVDALAQERFATHLVTDDNSTDQVVERIARDCGLRLARPRLSPLRFQLRRIAVGIRHIR